MKYLILVAALALAGCADRKVEATVQGAPGTNGSSCTTHQMEGGAIISCTDGTSSVIYNGANGLNGSNGVDGQDGTNGTNGTNGQNGVDGQNGTNGTNGSDGILEVINPCGEEFANDEVFLRLSSGRILALYDGGPNQDRLVLLAPGNYISTDTAASKSCSFTVTSDYKIINEVRH